MLLDDGGEGGQRTVHHRLHFFGVQPLDQLRAADDVEKQHADLAQAAGGLKGRRLRVQCGQAFEQGRQRRVDQRVAQRSAVRLQVGDRDLQGLLGVFWCGHIG